MKKGICCICGREKELTYEHIPPRGSGNFINVKAYKLDYLGVDSEEKLLENLNKRIFDNLVEGERYKQHQQGFGIYGTCSYCNNTVKAVYDKNYVNLANWMLYLIQKDPRLISNDSKSVKILYPSEFVHLNFVKCIVAMFAVFYGETLFDEHTDLRNFVMDHSSLAFDETKYKLYVYFLKSEIIYKCEPTTAGSISTPEGEKQLHDILEEKVKLPLTLEFGAHPFGFVLDIDNAVNRNELTNMSPWITSNKYCDLEFQLNAFVKGSPTPCQFE